MLTVLFISKMQLEKYLKEKYNFYSELNFVEFNSGWNEIIKNLSEEINKILGEDTKYFSVVQIKQKFGGLRYYYDIDYDKIDDEKLDKIKEAIEKAEEKSFQTCEICGNIGELKSNGYWIFTTCDECEKINDKTNLC